MFKSLESSQCGEPIYISMTPTNFLMVNHGNDIQVENAPGNENNTHMLILYLFSGVH